MEGVGSMNSTAWAFLKRDCLMATSYRAAFLSQMLLLFGGVSVLYYAGQVLGLSESPLLRNYGGNYFAFLLVGVAFVDFLNVSLATFNVSIRDNQMMGTLEMILLSPVKVPALLIYSSLWSYMLALIRFLFILAVGGAFYGFRLENPNLTGAALILLFSILSFAGVGILMAAFVMVFKKADISVVMSLASVFLGGVVFPPEVLPSWTKPLSALLPITHSVQGMREALMRGASIEQLMPQIVALALFGLLLFPLGLAVFSYAVNWTKATGTLGQY